MYRSFVPLLLILSHSIPRSDQKKLNDVFTDGNSILFKFDCDHVDERIPIEKCVNLDIEMFGKNKYCLHTKTKTKACVESGYFWIAPRVEIEASYIVNWRSSLLCKPSHFRISMMDIEDNVVYDTGYFVIGEKVAHNIFKKTFDKEAFEGFAKIRIEGQSENSKAFLVIDRISVVYNEEAIIKPEDSNCQNEVEKLETFSLAIVSISAICLCGVIGLYILIMSKSCNDNSKKNQPENLPSSREVESRWKRF